MATNQIERSQPSRRQFLEAAAAAGAGLIIGFRLPIRGSLTSFAANDGPFAPNAFIRIAPDSTVTVLSKHIEFGQGPYTGLATIVAEELDADWSQMRAAAAPADASLYNNLLLGPIQGTGGSTAIANSWDQLRQAGAQARAMLIQAAAENWKVAPSQISIEKGILKHAASSRSSSFGDLALRAASVKLEGLPQPKDSKDYRLIGRDLPKLDTKEKTTGEAIYTFDIERPNMLTALVQHPPRFGGRVKSFDASRTRRISGVVDVVEVPEGVAVLAKGFWAAKEGRDALRVEWDESGAEKRSSDELIRDFQRRSKSAGALARNDGNVEDALKGADKTFEAEFIFPYLAHAPMEPDNCVIERTSDGIEMWFGSQVQTIDQQATAAVFGLQPNQVKINTLLAGGSFGRRATPVGDRAVEAAHILKASGAGRPVKLLWTREDDIQGGRYRPLYVHRLRAGLDSKGRITGWDQTIVGQSIMAGSPFEALIRDGIDGTSVEGASTLPYSIPNLRVSLHSVKVGVPVLWWRSVGHTHTAYSTETFFDQLAKEAGRDPVEFRLELLKDRPRHAQVLRLAAEKAGWGGSLPAGRARGIALHESFGSFVAQVAEISLRDDGMPKVERVVCAVDCGIAVNPNIVRHQMEGGIGFGLGAALHDEIVLDKGRVVQSNFHDYWPLRIEEMPKVEVHIAKSTQKPTGVGEPGVPPIAPAVANALYALNGTQVRRLPFARSLSSKG